MKTVKKVLALAGICAAAFGTQASCYEYNTAGGTANLGASTQINSTDRICLFQGTVNLNAGASVVCGGNESGSCNFLGVDKSNAATLNVNGGTLHCSLAKGAGFLKISANDYNQTATLNINSGTVTVLLTASAITGLPSGIVKNGRPYSCRMKIEDVEGGQSLVACAGAMVIYVR